MTGIEAIADSVPLFKKPEAQNAVTTTYWMAGILIVMLAGITFLMMHHHVMPQLEITALSQLAEATFGRSFMYYYIQITTMVVLYLAANTAYNGLPVLLAIIAKDGYLPRYLGTRGERLTFSNGIILITIAAAALILLYNGEIENLISLYAIGVFVSFTIAQFSMVIHWKKEAGRGWHFRAALNTVGGLITGLVVMIITVTKFTHGAWVILIFIPMMIYMFKKIRAHYDDLAEQLHLPLECENPVPQARTGKHYVIVPVSTPTRIVWETLEYAKAMSGTIIALHIATDEEAASKVIDKWACWAPGVELKVVYSPYRLLIKPIIEYVEELDRLRGPQDFITILIPEFETKRWWHRLLHNQTGWSLRTALILREKVIVATIPYHLTK